MTDLRKDNTKEQLKILWQRGLLPLQQSPAYKIGGDIYCQI